MENLYGGGILEIPIMKKEGCRVTMIDKQNFMIEGGVSGMQGFRTEMEDQHINIKMPSAPDHLFLGVFDGHGGAGCAIYVCGTDPKRNPKDKNLYEILEETNEWVQYLRSGKPDGTEKDIGLLRKALITTYKEIDIQMQDYIKKNEDKYSKFGGCTAITVMITPEYIVCANAGDSRAIISKAYGKAIELSQDHKPDNPEELARIEAAGGYVSVDNRVDGYLALSRALGDFELKGDPGLLQEQQKVSCVPEIILKKREPNDEMVVLACDGLWDVFSNDEVIENVRQIWNEGERNIQLVAEEMCDQALFTGSTDNISVIVVKLQGAKISSYGEGVIGRRKKRLFP